MERASPKQAKLADQLRLPWALRARAFIQICAELLVARHFWWQHFETNAASATFPIHGAAEIPDILSAGQATGGLGSKVMFHFSARRLAMYRYAEGQIHLGRRWDCGFTLQFERATPLRFLERAGVRRTKENLEGDVRKLASKGQVEWWR